MQNLTILNKKEIKELFNQIVKQWGARLDLEYGFLRNNKNKIFLINKEISNIDIEKLRINSMGNYFCETDYGVRLSIEGSQIVGPNAIKNVLEISEIEAKKWMMGEDLETTEQLSGFIIIKSNNDFFGTGKYSNGKILNYVGKERRVSAVT